MMIGTADEIVKAPEKGPLFVEDLPEEEQVVALVHTGHHSVHVLPILSLLVFFLPCPSFGDSAVI
jgi:hypothetical protein